MDGVPAAVSGLVLAPDAPVTGPRPVVALAHGTVGIADACAPSRAPFRRLELTTAGPLLAAQGWVVVATDYAGLGTPGPHPYLDGPSAGRNVLDSLVAVRALRDAGASATAAIGGVSQGGHAALWALRLAAAAEDGMPDGTTIVGGVVAAPPGDLLAVADWSLGPDAGPVAWRNDIFVATAWADAYGLALDRLLVPAALPVAEAARTDDCDPAPDANPLALDMAGDPEVADLLVRNSPIGAPVAGPILYLQGDADDQVPVESARRTRDALCAGGTLVDYRELAGVGHAESITGGDRLADAVAWMAERFAGSATEGTCPGR